MVRVTRLVLIVTAVTIQTALVGSAAAQAPVRYEAELATNDNTEIAVLADASGGKYVKMKTGNIIFSVNAPSAGFYTVWAFYSQTYDVSKTQKFVVNGDVYGTPSGTIGFPLTGTKDGPLVFKRIKAIGKVRLKSGANTLAIAKDWGYVDIDYIEVGPYVSEPFTISGSLVTPNASPNARKVYGFLRDNFQKKVISGVMTNTVMANDGRYTPNTPDNQAEMAHIKSVSGKLPALMGLDFMHSSGKSADGEWFLGYTKGTLALAEEFFNRGGIPIYCWHWRDPLKNIDDFYSDETTFDLTKAFKNSNYTETNFNENSAEYKGIVADIDRIAGYLKGLADKGVPVLWRPLHEAAGGWFWWGRDKKPEPCRALYRFMFDRMVRHHGLNNLIWVWTTEESGRELEWYPGDDVVDIVGRDYYPNPDQRAKEHGSRVASFENIKTIFGAKKIIALSENGAIPHPDSLVADGAEWSWFMPWYGDFTMDVNVPAIWNKTMNHSYVITLDKMPGWDNYNVTSAHKTASGVSPAQSRVSVTSRRNTLELNVTGIDVWSVELFDLHGARLAVLSKDRLSAGKYNFAVNGLARQMCFVRVTGIDKRVTTLPVKIN
jgi:mannan endo-1,4-beta-mannosidase